MRTDGLTALPRRLLVVANLTATADTLWTTVRSYVEGPGPTEVLVVAPALDTRLRHRPLHEDGARRAAERRVRLLVARLSSSGVDAEGMIGDADPMRAIDDSLRIFPADRLIVATLPEGLSTWLAQDLVSGAARRWALPLTHVVVGSDECEVVRHRPADAPLAA